MSKKEDKQYNPLPEKSNGTHNIDTTHEQTEDKGPNLTFSIQRIYVKDISFETSNTPQVFRETWAPNINLELNVNTNKLEPEETYEVILRVTATVKLNDKPAFLAEVKQAGIFSLIGFSGPQLHQMIGSYCPSILFPYAREVISNLSIRGGFPQLYLTPINFDAIYAQQLQQQEQQQHPKEQAE